MGLSGAPRFRPTPLIGVGIVVGYLVFNHVVGRLGSLQYSGEDVANFAGA